ncbi:DHS-like NAD/FAD-binding domain-containing protein [Tilletiaria anomala UBC 951]|uniref:DHS-like NAD/FAD-binding domain-containing protein n=1 Tax=Tilletiaria anomala (strain ATCC 24038 / CBS 436.72 / UBC 951) TaxID=1037660 RepID=A0A066VFP6_TILAU|nr:DHS-like NAD/FAD-binding domain-containing protein [Tilletiaria anomala UBC 951]KDN37594.1 DHS-like NAD/FAD-binding domain-containing protein [Tilletiaria anomala UBC 951]
MRISIPSIPHNGNTRSIIEYTVPQAGEMVAEFLRRGRRKNLIMTGAGVSVDSGIAPYRGENGHYTVHKTYRPIFFHEFTALSDKGHTYRQRYWSRSYLGFPPVRHALPNKTHYSIAALQRLGHVPEFITQNVDSLHHAATPSPSLAAASILELHGTLAYVVCVSRLDGTSARANRGDGRAETSFPSSASALFDPDMHARLALPHLHNPRATASHWSNTSTGSSYAPGCGFRGSRAAFQDVLTDWNPRWADFSAEMAASNTLLKTNPDGDVQLGADTNYSSFMYPPCPSCGGVLKPAVVFFGESVPDELRDRSHALVASSDSFMLVGSSLATYSAFRLVKQAVEERKRVMIVNIGPTRADPIVPDKIELPSSDVLGNAAKLLAGSMGSSDPVLKHLLESGVKVQPTRRVTSS